MKKTTTILLLLCFCLTAKTQTNIDQIVPTFAGINRGNLTQEVIDNTDSLVLLYTGAPLANYKVISFEINPWQPGSGVFKFNNSNKWTEEQRNFIKNLPIFAYFFIQDIKVKRDSLIISLPQSIKITLDGPRTYIYKPIQNYDTLHPLNDNSSSASNIKFEELIGGSISKKDFLINDSLLIDYPEAIKVDLNKCPKIISYTCFIRFENDKNKWIEITGNKITPHIKKLIKTKKGIRWIEFYNIVVKTKDGEIIKVSDLTLFII